MRICERAQTLGGLDPFSNLPKARNGDRTPCGDSHQLQSTAYVSACPRVHLDTSSFGYGPGFTCLVYYRCVELASTALSGEARTPMALLSRQWQGGFRFLLAKVGSLGLPARGTARLTLSNDDGRTRLCRWKEPGFSWFAGAEEAIPLVALVRRIALGRERCQRPAVEQLQYTRIRCIATP